jgi:hypothetical protein
MMMKMMNRWATSEIGSDICSVILGRYPGTFDPLLDDDH